MATSWHSNHFGQDVRWHCVTKTAPCQSRPHTGWVPLELLLRQATAGPQLLLTIPPAPLWAQVTPRGRHALCTQAGAWTQPWRRRSTGGSQTRRVWPCQHVLSRPIQCFLAPALHRYPTRLLAPRPHFTKRKERHVGSGNQPQVKLVSSSSGWERSYLSGVPSRHPAPTSAARGTAGSQLTRVWSSLPLGLRLAHCCDRF